MNYTIYADAIEITCTMAELEWMENMHGGIYATPPIVVTTEPIAECYLDDHRRWKYDFMIANVDDFAEAEGCDDFGFDYMTDEEKESCAEETTTILLDLENIESRMQN